MQRNKQFKLTHHLFYIISALSIILSVYSQWSIAVSPIATSHFILNLINFIVVMIGGYYLLQSKKIHAFELIGYYHYKIFWLVLLLLPVFYILTGFQGQLLIDIKLVILCMLIFSYSMISHLNLNTFYFQQLDFKESDALDMLNFRAMNKELFINASLIISLLMLVLVASSFSLSLKTGLLIFIIALNFLLLSVSLINRALFYVFMLVLSASILTFKLYLSHSHSTGLLLVSSVLLIFYLIHWLDDKKDNALECFKLEQRKKNNPDKILWCYPANDFNITQDISDDLNSAELNEAIKNV